MKTYDITITVRDIDGLDGRCIGIQLIRPVGDRREALSLVNPFIFLAEDTSSDEGVEDQWLQYKQQSIISALRHRAVAPFIAGMPYKHLLEGTIGGNGVKE